MNAQKTKDNGQYVSLPFFGLPKIIKYIRKNGIKKALIIEED